MYLVSHGLVGNKHILPYVEQAHAENLDDFETLKLWADAYSKEKPKEAEAIYRRLVKTRPNSLRAHYTLGKHILDTHPNPTEAIPYLEKAYQLNPKWYGPLMGLGDVYHKLGQKEKAYKYFQAGRALGYSRM